jgi:serine/threonine-protein kinase
MKTRGPQLAVLVIATAFLGYWALLVYCEVWRPAPLGLLLITDAGRVKVDDVVTGEAADRAGLRRGDYIALFDGHRVTGHQDWMSAEANFEIGRPIALSVERDGASVHVAVIPEFASWQEWISAHGPELLIVRTTLLATLLIAVFVALKRPRDPTALVASAFLGTIGVFSVTLPYRLATIWRSLPLLASVPLVIPFMSSVAVAAWGYSFFAMFPRVRFRSRLVWTAVWMFMVPGLIGQGLFGYYTVVRGEPAPHLPSWPQNLFVVGVAYLAAALIALVRNYRQLTDVNEQRRVRVVMIGLAVGAIAGTPVVVSYWRSSTNNFGQPFFGSTFAIVGTFLFLALPLSFAYAILRHRLFDVGMMIRQGLRYMLARHVLLALVPALFLFLGVDLLAHRGAPIGEVLAQRLWVYAAVAALAVVARIQRQSWLDALDRRFFRERYNAQRLLRQVAEDVRQTTSLDPVAPTVVSRIEQALHPTFVALLILDPDSRRYRTVATSPEATAPQELDAENKVIALARLLGKPLEINGSESTWLARQMPVEDVRSVRASSIDLLVPIGSTAGDVLALFALGPKRSEEPYTDDDGELLMAIAENIALRLARGPVASTAGLERFEECPACGVCYGSGTLRCRTDGSRLIAVNAPRLLVDRYQLERRVGRGGMGTVYVALDTSLHRRVAVKLIRDDLFHVPGAAERFQREARAAAAFSHPNVVTVHDFGVTGTHAFLVMELLQGQTLRDMLRREEHLDCGRALAILRDVSAAVEAAHRRHMVHRDLKPENIWLGSDGSSQSAKILDFGLATFLEPAGGEPGVRTNMTGGAVLGTPLYMAPEQLRGDEPNPSWDLWALAVIAFEMVSGSHPFESAAAYDPRRRDAAVDPRLLHLPHGLPPFFARALALNRNARPQSAAVFVAEFERSIHA